MLIKVNQLTGGLMKETYYQAQMCGCWVNVVASGLEKCSWLTALVLQKSTAQRDERKGITPSPIMINLFLLN